MRRATGLCEICDVARGEKTGHPDAAEIAVGVGVEGKVRGHRELVAGSFTDGLRPVGLGVKGPLHRPAGGPPPRQGQGRI
jgi:hypothetical protein